jgi:hypothetical protein
MNRKEFLVTAAGVAATLAASTAALAQTTTTPSTQQKPSRGEVGSAKNLKKVRYMVERLIDELQRDRHDYGGYRVKAVGALQQARADIEQALQWDATHPK